MLYTMNSKIIFSALGSVLQHSWKRYLKVWSPLYHPIVPFKLSDIGEGIREVTVKQSYIQPDQHINQFEDICEVESDKASVTITSRFDGLVKNVYFKQGDVIAVGSTLFDIDVPRTSPQKTAEDDDAVSPIETTVEVQKILTLSTVETAPRVVHTETKPHPPQSSEAQEYIEKPLATPAVRRLARDHNVQLSSIKGTGKGGRIMKEDILQYLNQPTQLPVVPSFSDQKEVIEPLAGYMKVMVRTMTESNHVPTLALSDEIDVTEVESLRSSIKSQTEVKVTLLPFLIKAISLSLLQYPILNAVFEDDSIKYKSCHNIGIAVDTASGLVVPNIKNVQRLSIRQVAVEVQRLHKLAQERKLSLADTSNCTFTISNIGAIGGIVLKPLILPPQLAIVGIGRVQALPRYEKNDELCKRLIVTTSWAADHRVIDGATVARCSNLVKRYLEMPGFLMLDA